MAEANHTRRVPEYDDDGDAHGLARTTRTIVEPQTTLEAPHNAPTPTSNSVIRSVSVSHPPAETTVPAKPPPSRLEMDPDGAMYTTPTTSGTASPAIGPIFVHHASVDLPRDTAATGHLDPAPPTNVDPIDVGHDPTHVTHVDITPGNPVAVDPIQ